ncbi:outer membrane protein assembly factor BamD [Hypericibacter adhaerens]|jgi:hypothetical protein|uniref:hypothetical protein n=1 Tax=Hypericibacter adhaerens TaxID=2602016 RepID=UPI00124913A3|nr:hypothetical protein [Hypericibacter adhaerens]
MFRRSILAAALMAAALTPMAARADGAAIANKLKGTPATLWDLTLVRVEAALASWVGGKGVSTFVGSDADKIILYVYEEGGKATKAECKALIDRVKKAGGIDPKTGYPDNPASDYAALLNYAQIDQFSVDESYAETADSMFEVDAVAGGGENAVNCKGPLVSAEVTYPTP